MRKPFVYLLAATVLSGGVTATAQQPKKVPRIGICRRPTQLLSPPVPRQFG
jgi:hypothetical protein